MNQLDQDLITAASTKGQTSKVAELLANPEVNPNCTDTNEFTPINCAAWYGCLSTVRLLIDDPRVDPTQGAKIGESPIFCAVQKRHLNVLRFLAYHPRVKVNQRKRDGATAFLFAAQEGYEAEMKILLQIPEVDVNISLDDGASPLFLACQNGHLNAVKLMLALRENVHNSPWKNKTPIEHARLKGHTAIVDLLESYDKDKNRVRMDLQREPGIAEIIAADFLAYVVFLCDGYVMINENRRKVAESFGPACTIPKIYRFLDIVKALPLELQMVLCNRAFGLSKDLVDFHNREAAFRRVSRLLGK